MRYNAQGTALIARARQLMEGLQMSETMPMYPFLFEPIYKQKVWGGRNLAKLGRQLPDGDECLVGESWEIADLSATSASGGGGGAERSVIRNGPLAGRTLHDVLEADQRRLVGELALSEDDAFPLLVKFLDAQQNLSVQVHPSQAYADKHPEAHLKSEAWYVVHAEPGAVIYKGVKPGVTPGQFRQAIEEDAVEPLLIKVAVRAGDCHYLPSGTCHALGAGVMVAEVQTPSDTTFRVYDWGRQGRKLHVEQAMACIHFGPADTAGYEPQFEIVGQSATITRLVMCEYFQIDRCRADRPLEEALSHSAPVIWMCLEGGGRIVGTEVDAFSFGPGDTLLIPPNLPGGEARMSENTTWLAVRFPQAEPTTIA